MKYSVKALSIITSLVLLSLTFLPVSAASPIVITWFIGLGQGNDPDQIAAQNAVVTAFNASHPDIQLEIILADPSVAADTLRGLIASGNAPDIVGPQGMHSANTFGWEFLDLQPLVDSTGYDLTQFPEAAVNIHRLPGQGLVSLPFSTYPSFIYYRPALFDAAGLAYPPHSFGELYDGATWDTAKLREISMLLTLDINGKNATDIDFDPNQIVQWGFTQQFSELRGYVTMFGASHPIDATGTAFLPTPYADGFPWYYDGMWVDHFIPNAEQKAAMDNNPFMSGKLAMANSHLWYTCCAGVNDWDIAVVPSYNGVYTAKLHDDGFRIMETTEHPQEAFTVLTYLIGEAAPDLLAVYHGMPARPADQPAFFAALDADFPQGVDWQVAMDSINYADSPNLEAMIPNYQVAYDRLVEFQLLIESTDGLDIATELADLIADLQIIASERLADGGFEGELLYFWSQKNVTGDKVKCNTPEKQVAFEGECAYRFKGGVGEKSKLIQNAETVYVLAGKDLTLSGMVNAKGAPNATVKVIVTYQNTSLPKGKLKAKINAPTSGYQPLTGNLSLTLSDDALAIKVQFGNKSVSGKIYLDALSLTTTGSATANLISLPPLPALPLP